MMKKKVIVGLLASTQLVSAGFPVFAESVSVGAGDSEAVVGETITSDDLDQEVSNDNVSGGNESGLNGSEQVPGDTLEGQEIISGEEVSLDPASIPLLDENGEKLLRRIYGGWSQARHTPIQVGVYADHTLKLPGTQDRHPITRVGTKEGEAGRIQYAIVIERQGEEEVIRFDYQADPKGDNKLILDGDVFVYTGFNGPTQYEPDMEKGTAQHAYQDLHGEWLDIDNHAIEISEFEVIINHESHKIQRATTSLEGPTRNVVFLFNTDEGLHLRYNVDKDMLEVAGLPQSSTFEVRSEFVRSGQAEEAFSQRRQEAADREQQRQDEEARKEQERLEKEERDKQIAEEAAKKREEEEQARKEEAERIRKENEERAEERKKAEREQRDREAREQQERKAQLEADRKAQEEEEEEARRKALEEAEEKKTVETIQGDTQQIEQPQRSQNIQQPQQQARVQQQQQRQPIPMPRTQQPGQGQVQNPQTAQQSGKTVQNDLPSTGEVATGVLSALGTLSLGGALAFFRRRR